MKCLAALISIVLSTLVSAETVSEMIVREHNARMAKETFVDKTLTPKTARSFTAVLDRPNIMLHVIERENSHFSTKNAVVVSMVIENLSEVQRQFIIAHELGHVILRHAEKKIEFFEQYVQGQVHDQDQIDRVQNLPQFRELLHSHELQADTFAMVRLLELGWPKNEIIYGFMGLGRFSKTETHPSTFERIQNLRK